MLIETLIGIVIVIISIIVVGIYSGRKINNSSDFINGGGKVGKWMVCGGIMGALVSSQATIGTAQLAFYFGLSAWWFTLGSGIGCLILGLIYSGKMRESNVITEIEIISNEYGDLSGRISSILCCLGIFLSVLAQVIACSGLIITLLPEVSLPLACIVSIFIMAVYVVFGGTWGAGMGGILKLILLYIASILGMATAVHLSGGLDGIIADLNSFISSTDIYKIQAIANKSNIVNSNQLSIQYFSLVSRGAVKDIGSGISLIIGVISTQTYAQCIMSASSDKEAKKGALLSAFLIPPIGIAGIIIGLYMRSHYILASEVASLKMQNLMVPNLPVLKSTIQVFPMFVLNHMGPLVAGLILGTLLISVVGGGAGLSLGMATIIVKDIFKNIYKDISNKTELILTRATIILILVVSAVLASLVKGTLINDFGFLSMGLRGSVIFVPLTCALFLKNRINRKAIILSIILAPISVIISKVFFVKELDPLFVGIIISFIAVFAGYKRKSKKLDRL